MGFEAKLVIGTKGHGTADSRNWQVNARINISPTDLQKYKIRGGDYVILRSDQLFVLGIAWPSAKTKHGSVVLGSMWAGNIDPVNESIVVSVERVVPEELVKEDAISITLVAKSGAYRGSIGLSESETLTTYMKNMLTGATLFRKAMLQLSVHGRPHRFQLVQCKTATSIDQSCEWHTFRITPKTKLVIQWKEEEEEESGRIDDNKQQQSGYEHIGGLQNQIQSIHSFIELPLSKPQTFENFGLPPPKGVLMYGPPGTGKTMIARAVANVAKASFWTINGPEILGKFVGESEAKLRSIFLQAEVNSPALIFIDEIDVLCPQGADSSSEVEKRVVATLLTLMDGLKTNTQVVVLAATNRPNALDPALRRPGRLDREIEIGIPNEKARIDILSVSLAKLPHSLSQDEIESIAMAANGFVGADLNSLCREASLHALNRIHRNNQHVNEIQITNEDMKLALTLIQPSAIREIAVDVPHVRWQDIGGQSEIKQQLKETVEWPIQHPEAFVRMGIRPPKGVLMYGPPGCSKTLTAKALATEGKMNFIAIKGPELFSKWVGESEKAIQTVFRRARAAAPTVVFFDEIDAISAQRGGDGGGSQVADRVLSQLLNELDGIQPLKRVIVVAATNRPDLIDTALMRPGRIDRVLYVGPPDCDARFEILKIHTRKMPLDASVDLKKIAEETERFSGAELESLCREAAFCAIEDDSDAQSVHLKHFQRAKMLVVPQINNEMLEFYQSFKRRH